MSTPSARSRAATYAAAAVAGVLAAGAGLGIAMLVAALLGGESPALALGNRVVDLTPVQVKDWAVRHFGTHDKVILLGSVYAVMTLAAALAGVVGRRSLRAGVGVTVALNLVALFASVHDSLGFRIERATLVPPLVCLVVSVAGLVVLLRTSRTTATVPAGFDRRAFLAAALATGTVAVAGGGIARALPGAGATSRARVRLPAAAVNAPPIPPGTQLDVPGITPYLTTNGRFYRVDTALSAPQVNADTWRLTIHGLVDRPLELSFDDILAMPLEEQRITLTCVSNEVGGHYLGNATWLGVRTRDLLRRVGIRGGADAVKSTSVDQMTIGTPLAALTDDRGSLLAVGMNGQPLPIDHGFPARLVVPGLFGYVSATKWVTDLEVTRFRDFQAYWTRKGYAAQAPIKTESRIDVPRQFATVQPGKVAVAGVAWAQHTGISAVHVQVDDGPWEPARLASQDGIETWRQWVYEWPATSGQHVIQVRATDESGTTQTPHRASVIPDGATGWHSVTVNVA